MTVASHLIYSWKNSDQPLIGRHSKQELLPENESGTDGFFSIPEPFEAAMGPDFRKVTAMETSVWPD